MLKISLIASALLMATPVVAQTVQPPLTIYVESGQGCQIGRVAQFRANSAMVEAKRLAKQARATGRKVTIVTLSSAPIGAFDHTPAPIGAPVFRSYC